MPGPGVMTLDSMSLMKKIKLEGMCFTYVQWNNMRNHCYTYKWAAGVQYQKFWKDLNFHDSKIHVIFMTW